MRVLLVAIIIAFSACLGTRDIAFANESAYTKLEYETGCVWAKSESEEEAQMGGNGICSGYRGYPVYFAEGDLRQFLSYGPVDDPRQFVGGFSQWNSVHDTIEWRLSEKSPVAVIHRWFIDNIDPQTGSADPGRRGQVLVISKVADAFKPLGNKVSCIVGYVDALENPKANRMARDVADNQAEYFQCGFDRPTYYGNRGPLSGAPNDLAE